jgi:hypothetical protein
VDDVSGNNNYGTMSGATRTSSGRYGRALNFDGTNDWVTVNDAASLDLTSGMTLEAWVYPTATSTPWRTIVMKEQSGNLIYSLAANSDRNQPATSVFAGSGRTLYGGSRLAVNTWTHLAATYDGATQRLYVNGSQVATRSQNGGIRVSTGPLQIGRNSVWGQYFRGRIDEVRIYNCALTTSEIRSDRNSALPTPSTTAPAVARSQATFEDDGAWAGLAVGVAFMTPNHPAAAGRRCCGLYPDPLGC